MNIYQKTLLPALLCCWLGGYSQTTPGGFLNRTMPANGCGIVAEPSVSELFSGTGLKVQDQGKYKLSCNFATGGPFPAELAVLFPQTKVSGLRPTQQFRCDFAQGFNLTGLLDDQPKDTWQLMLEKLAEENKLGPLTNP